jgi:hypothetical protein
MSPPPTRRRFLQRTASAGAALLACSARSEEPAAAAPAKGPLRVHPTNPRYFTDGSRKAVYLTGAHTWTNLQDIGLTDPPPVFDFAAHLDLLARHHPSRGQRAARQEPRPPEAERWPRGNQ